MQSIRKQVGYYVKIHTDDLQYFFFCIGVKLDSKILVKILCVIDKSDMGR